MVQETGETRDAIIEDDEKQIQIIMDRNSKRSEKYWIVIFAKPSKTCVDGKPTLIKHIKEYFVKPASSVGMIIGEVDPTRGTLAWEVNMPQRPLDFDMLQTLGAQSCDEAVVETTSIPNAYVTQ